MLSVVTIFVFFQNLDWNALEAKQIPPPIKPVIRDDTDTSNFSEEFTRMVPIDSPAVTPNNADKVFRVRSSLLFNLYVTYFHPP